MGDPHQAHPLELTVDRLSGDVQRALRLIIDESMGIGGEDQHFASCPRIEDAHRPDVPFPSDLVEEATTEQRAGRG